MPRTQYHDAMSQDAWTERLGELRDFKATHGHCNVPRGYADNPALARWVNKQRCHYKHMKRGKSCPMTPKRARTLEKEGFLWEIRNRGGRGRGLGSRSNLRIKVSASAAAADTGAAATGSEVQDVNDNHSDEEGHCSGCQGARDGQAAEADEPILLCDGCDREYHLGCVRPPLTEVPEGDFYCGACDGDVAGTASAAGTSSSASKTQSKAPPDPKKGGDSSDSKKKAKTSSSPNQAGEEPVEEECCACHGSRNEEAEAADEPVLLCDGLHCDREYHLGCVDPPISKVPEGHFFCSNCAHVGTSAHLEEYLDRSEEQSADFASSRQYVRHLLREQMKESLAAEDAVEARKPMDELLATEGRAPKRARKSLSRAGREGPTSDDDEDEFLHWPERERPPRSELARASEFYALVMGGRDRGGISNAAASSSSAPATVSMDESKDDSTTVNYSDTNAAKLRPDFFVGKPIQVYCPLDNSYHNGRIVHWRKSSRGYPEYYGSGEIASLEFLIRFPPGINGRRKGLHRWIILEEHSVAVSLAIVFAQQKKGRGLSGWKPAQIMVRTSLELIPVRHLLVDDGEERGLAFSFGETVHSYLKLREEICDFFSPFFAEQRGEMAKTRSTKTAIAGSVLSATKCPAKSNVGDTNTTDKFADLPVLLAYLEYDEQQRVNKWSRMPLSNPFHKRALTAVDEYALPPVVMQTANQFISPSKEGEERVNEEAKDEEGGPADDKAQSPLTKSEKFPVCPQIERGIDRQWLSRLAKAENICVNQSLDVMQGLKVNPVPCMASAMTRLQEQRQRNLPASTSCGAIARSPTGAKRKSLGY